ncbi:MAG: sensor histidine kinase [Betaproteobacteria bacterium]
MTLHTSPHAAEPLPHLGLWRAPIFGPTWWRRRSLVLGGLCLAAFVLLAIAVGQEADEVARGIRTFVDAVFWLFVVVIGPGLATWVAHRPWPLARKAAALIAAILLPIAATAFLRPAWEDWVKRAIPTDPNKPVFIVWTFRFGANIDKEPSETPADAAKQPTASPDRMADLQINAVLAFLLGGGLALIGHFPQQRRLAEAQRRRELAAAQAARREAELKLSVLAAQVEPHFLYNTLAAVRGAVASDPARAVTLIDRLADYLRLTIPRLRADGEAQGATLGRQLEIVEAYLALIHARLPRLAVSVQVPPELAGARFPPLMLISLAENAVKHGIEPKVGAARIEVAAQRAGEVLAVSVCDDGVGFTGSGGGSGLGLANIRERLAQLYGERAALTLVARDAGGVCATISVPYEPVADADRDPR